jgi:CRP-like cAMP-binding protein
MIRADDDMLPAIGGNSLLDGLAPALSARIQSSFQPVHLCKNEPLLHAGQPIRHVYFPTRGLVSVAKLTIEGQAVDLAMVASEGLVGVSVILENAIAPHDAIVRIAGSAVRVDSRALRAEINFNQRLRSTLLEYASRLSMEVDQAVACQCFHTVLQRLCRWLVVASDRTKSDVIEMTQDNLAQVLGVARPVVTKAALELQDAGAIRCRHGRIAIVSRSMLRRSACECLGALKPGA